MSKEELKVEEQKTTKPVTMDYTDVRAGLIVGVRADGSYIFEPIGPDVGLLELFGLVEHAHWRLMRLRDATDKSDEIAQLRKLCEGTATMVRAIVKSLAHDISLDEKPASVSPTLPPIS
jgi:hypothetical protein